MSLMDRAERYLARHGVTGLRQVWEVNHVNRGILIEAHGGDNPPGSYPKIEISAPNSGGGFDVASIKSLNTNGIAYRSEILLQYRLERHCRSLRSFAGLPRGSVPLQPNRFSSRELQVRVSPGGLARITPEMEAHLQRVAARDGVEPVRLELIEFPKMLNYSNSATPP